MIFKNLDLFSTQFQFNVGQRQVSKRSTIGAALSIVVIAFSIAYFIYLLLLYLGNQIDPKYKSQTLITDESIKVDYHNDLIAFRFEYETNKPLEELEQQTGKKYITYIPPVLEIVTQNVKKYINLDIIQCQSQYLQGYNCLDFSKIPNETLENNNLEDIQKYVQILVYRCSDIDIYQTSIPSNCASDQEIAYMMNNPDARFRTKMFTSQYNTFSEQIQPSYKNVFLYFNPDECLLARFKTVKQTSSIKKGPFIQQQTQFSSPIDYLIDQRVFNRQTNKEFFNLAAQMFFIIGVSEQYQQIQIQYATFMEILAICNSTFAVIMGVGFIGRYFAKQLIKEDIQLLLLQNVYQSQYLKSLKKFNIFQNRILDQDFNNERQTDIIENTQTVFIPSFLTKSKETVEINKTNRQEFLQDFVMEDDKIEKHKILFLIKRAQIIQIKRVN